MQEERGGTLKVIHVINSLRWECGGPVRSVQGLVAALERCGVEAWILAMTTDAKPWMDGIPHYRMAHATDYAGYKKAIRDLIDEVHPDVVHLHNLWTPDLHAAAVVCRERGIPYVFSPRGTLETWAFNHKWLKKRIAWFLYQRHDLNCAAALHVTVEKEKESCARLGLRPPVLISPNAVNTPKTLPPRNLRADGFRRVLFMARVHMQKGILDFAEAWGRVRPRGWKFEIAGFDEDGSLTKVREIAQRGGYADDFIYAGPQKDEEKWTLYRRADLVVLPTYTENFGMTVVEALYAGVPVLTTKGAPWSELETRRCGWWVENKVEERGRGREWRELDAALREAIALSDEEREAMGRRGRALVDEKYTWDAVGQQMKSAYEGLR